MAGRYRVSVPTGKHRNPPTSLPNPNCYNSQHVDPISSKLKNPPTLPQISRFSAKKMSRLMKWIIFRSNSLHLTSLSYSHPHFVSPTISPRKNFLCTTHKFSTTTVSRGEALEGLLDPDPFPPPNSPPKPISTEELTFLFSDSPPANPTTTSSSAAKSDSGKFSDDAILIARAINVSDSDMFNLETEYFLRKFRAKLQESLVVDVLKLVENPQLGVQFFVWAGRQIGYTHSPPVYHVLLDLMGCDRNERLQEHFIGELRESDSEGLAKLLQILIRRRCRIGQWNVALEELGRLKDLGYKPSRATYNALLEVFLKADRLDGAHLVYDEMMSAGFRMNYHVLGSFAYSLCKAGKWREALDFIEREENVPDTVLYTRMISGLCEALLFDEAMDFLNRMRCSSFLPNVVTYRIFLCACLNKQQLDKCKRILSMMIAEGCYPDGKIFNSLVNAFCKSGDYSYAYKLLMKMEHCGCQPGHLVYNILIGGICGNEELPASDALELAEKIYGEMLNAGLLLNKINVCNFARCLCGAGKFDEAYRVIHEMMSRGFVPDATTYTKVIEFLCASSKVEKAFLLFEEMKRTGVTPDVYTYSILIDAFCKAGLIVQAGKWFDEMVRDGCSPNVVTYTSLIHAYLKVGKICDANELFERMLSDGCVPNIVTYTALIDGHCKARNIEKACQIYDRMRGPGNVPSVDMYFRLNSNGMCEPNVFTYGALVDGLCKAQKVREAHDLLDTMLASGCEPNHIVYDALIDGFCKAGKLDEAQVVFAKMSERGYSPSEYTYGSLIDRMFKDKRLDLALKILSNMLESSCTPNVVIYTEMVDGLCKIGKTDEAYKLFLLMKDKGCSPNVVTYTAIVDGFGKAGKVDKCLKLFREMGERGCTPNYVTYRVLINHCCSAGLLDDAYHLLEEMKQLYWPIHVASYQKVIEGFNREFLTSLGLLDLISKNNDFPVAPAYEILIDSFCKVGKLERAVQLYREMSSCAQCSSTATTCSLLIKSLCLASKVDEGFELFADFLKRGGIFEVSVFSHLVTGLIRLNRWDDALQLSYSICHMVCALPLSNWKHFY